MRKIIIKEDVILPKTNIVLEKGDVVEVIESFVDIESIKKKVVKLFNDIASSFSNDYILRFYWGYKQDYYCFDILDTNGKQSYVNINLKYDSRMKKYNWGYSSLVKILPQMYSAEETNQCYLLCDFVKENSNKLIPLINKLVVFVVKELIVDKDNTSMFGGYNYNEVTIDYSISKKQIMKFETKNKK